MKETGKVSFKVWNLWCVSCYNDDSFPKEESLPHPSNLKKINTLAEFKSGYYQAISNVMPFKDFVKEYAIEAKAFIEKVRKMKDDLDLDFDFEEDETD